MKKNLIFLVSTILASFCVFGQENESTKVLLAAQNEFKNYLEKIPNGMEKLYGFNDREEFALANVGKPYQMVTLNNKFFEANVIGHDDYIIPTGEWRIPILINNEYRVLVTISKMNGEWEVVGLGGALLAKELGVFEKAHPSLNKSERLLRVYQIASDFMLESASTSTTLNAYPLESAKMSLELKASDLNYYPLEKLLPVIKKNIEHR